MTTPIQYRGNAYALSPQTRAVLTPALPKAATSSAMPKPQGATGRAPWVSKALNLGAAAALLGVGLYVRKTPALESSFVVTTDPKEWFKIGTGILAMGRVNKAFDFKPPPWLSALETVLFVNPLLARKWDMRALRQMLFTAPIISGMVYGSQKAEQALEAPLAKRGIPEGVTRGAIRIGSMVLGFFAFRPLFKFADRNGAFGKSATSQAVGAGAAVCNVCGSCGNPLFCITEAADFAGTAVNSSLNAMSGQPAGAHHSHSSHQSRSQAHASHFHASI